MIVREKDSWYPTMTSSFLFSFDLAHFGHANAIRQAKKMGDYVVVGVHSDGTWIQSVSLPFLLSLSLPWLTIQSLVVPIKKTKLYSTWLYKLLVLF